MWKKNSLTKQKFEVAWSLFLSPAQLNYYKNLKSIKELNSNNETMCQKTLFA